MSDDNNLDDWGDALEEQAKAEMSQKDESEATRKPNSDTWDDAIDEVSPTADEILEKPIPTKDSEIIKGEGAKGAVPRGLDELAEDVHSDMARLDKNILDDISMDVEVVAGNAKVRVKDLLRYTQGSVVELDTPHDAPLTVRVNGRAIARGDIVVINDKLGVRLTEIVSSKDRLESQKNLL